MRNVAALTLLICVLVSCAPRQYATSPSPQPATVINGVLYPPLDGSRKPRTVVPPMYPQLAEERRVDGFVDFEFTINPDGSVANPKITREFPQHMGFAENAARVFSGFTFPPDIVNGAPVATPATYRMAFKLH